MNKNILDDIFHDKLRDNLEEGEVVVWDGKPRFNNYSRLIATGSIFLFSGTHLFFSINDQDYWFAAFWLALIIFSIVELFYRQRKTRYLITNQRIIFQLPKMRNVQVHSLPLNHLDKVLIKDLGNKSGTIELHLKEPFETKIQTIDIRNNWARKNPTLELVDNAEEVRDYIEKGIQGKL